MMNSVSEGYEKHEIFVFLMSHISREGERVIQRRIKFQSLGFLGYNILVSEIFPCPLNISIGQSAEWTLDSNRSHNLIFAYLVTCFRICMIEILQRT